MSKDERRSDPTTAPRPSEGAPLEPLEVGWDDDTLPGFVGGESIFDRVTQIPDVPAEIHAKRVMAAAGEDDVISGLFERPAPPEEASSDAEGARIPSFHDIAAGAPPPVMSLPPLELELEPASPSAAGGSAPVARASTEPRGEVERKLGEIRDRYAMGDYSGALAIAEAVLETTPDEPEVARYAARCRNVLTDMYAARIGRLDRVARVVVPENEIRWLSLDHRAGFLLSLVDGRSTLDEVLDISGMARLDALKILYSLVEERVIALEPRG